jgi:hypothetical protein
MDQAGSNNNIYIMPNGTGKVGINTVTPAGQLDVEQTTAGNTGYAGYFDNTATTANYGVYSSIASTATGYGVYSTITGHGNTGYAGYFINTDTSSSANYGLYVSAAGSGAYGTYSTSNGIGVWASGGTDGVYGQGGGTGVYGYTWSTGAGYGVYGSITGHGNTGYAGYFTNTDTSSNSNYGVYGIVQSTGANSAGVYGECDSGNCQGVAGFSSNGTGVAGTGNNGYGVVGAGNVAGVLGNTYSTSTGVGVQGNQYGAANTGYAGFFSKTGTGAVNYGLYATTSSTTGWAGYFNGNIYLNGTITLSSDRRMKKDIEPLDTKDALDEIAALRPVAFTWKKTGVEDMGLIAQEVDLVYPDLVTHSGADETLALKYTSLIAPMIASIQELKKRDDELEIENATLRRDFNTYKEAHP